ncbi:hypothetical protein I6E53_01645 [Phocaeicola vulgatus]|uniref:hypothetical protein n=1 Tax=Phocaeicola vulgatus TaxID=821 RepID=UPI001F41BCFA|nr:hypothetical protein [Phocaeicola vulgatus]MCF2605239.1 hypothetical protein [Phocaeicola vulgatus]
MRRKRRRYYYTLKQRYIMARYIKANPKVAAFLHLENDRNQVSDGNYLLWQADMAAFGRIVDLPLILEQIGAIALMAHEAKQEQDGTVCRELPVATDPRFIVETDNQEPEAGTEEAAQEPEAGSEANQEETVNDKEATE